MKQSELSQTIAPTSDVLQEPRKLLKVEGYYYKLKEKNKSLPELPHIEVIEVNNNFYSRQQEISQLEIDGYHYELKTNDEPLPELPSQVIEVEGYYYELTEKNESIPEPPQIQILACQFFVPQKTNDSLPELMPKFILLPIIYDVRVPHIYYVLEDALKKKQKRPKITVTKLLNVSLFVVYYIFLGTLLLYFIDVINFTWTPMVLIFLSTFGLVCLLNNYGINSSKLNKCCECGSALPVASFCSNCLPIKQ